MKNLNGTTPDVAAESWTNGNLSWVRDEIIQCQGALEGCLFGIAIYRCLSREERPAFLRYLERWAS